MVKDTNNNQSSSPNADITYNTLKDAWSIRPCSIYRDEYKDCTSIKARFHQYFIHGDSSDCSQWQTDYDNCQRYKNSNGEDVDAGKAVISSEEQRRINRLHAHYANNTWKKRSSPPEDWAKPLPEWFVKRNENTFLDQKQMELDGQTSAHLDTGSYCAIM